MKLLRKNHKGQIAIFIALIFQVLFIFFAMVINVGLLVHHKINLQNSVDLAAYYGAMKQAEMLSAIGHMNYQIRQSWKLLSYRYRIIGTSGYGDHPAPPPLYAGSNPVKPDEVEYGNYPAFCVTFRPVWDNNPDNESSCKDVNKGAVSIPNLQIPKITAGFLGFNNAVKTFSARMREKGIQRCMFLGPANWNFLARAVYSFKQDTTNRKANMYALANSMSKSTESFYDVDNGDVRTGVQKTLEKNLTSANRDGYQMKFYNSLASEGCASSGDITKPPGWLSEISVVPGYLYADFVNGKGGGDSCVLDIKDISSIPEHSDVYPDSIKPLQPFVEGEIPGLWHSTLGVEKNPWCMAYVGVSATAHPKIPFMPLNGSIELRAKAFAKPFGGKIGPWYNESWPRGAPHSVGGKKTDPLWPPRTDDGGQIPDYKDKTRLPNYSRFVGDKLGLTAQSMMAALGGPLNQGVFQFELYENSENYIEDANANPSADILAWNKVTKTAPSIRNLEISAIMPDIFDITYYTIDPDFYHNYFTRLEVGMQQAGTQRRFRSDLGSRMDDDKLKSFSIMDQIETAQKEDNPLKIDFKNKVFFPILKWEQVLTSWTEKSQSDFTLDPSMFGTCHLEINKEGPDGPVYQPGSCISGGRSGYSVKITSSELLKSGNLPLGGEGGGEGPILNPPPDDF